MKIHYEVAEHDGGWAYKRGDVFSEPYPDRATALAAARRAAAEQHVPGSAAYIEYQDEGAGGTPSSPQSTTGRTPMFRARREA